MPMLTDKPNSIVPFPSPTPALTQVLQTSQLTQASKLTLTSPFWSLALTRTRSHHELLWGDSLIDATTEGHMRRLEQRGPQPLRGLPVEVQERD